MQHAAGAAAVIAGAVVAGAVVAGAVVAVPEVSALPVTAPLSTPQDDKTMDLNWSLSRTPDGDTLIVDYTLWNRGAEGVLVLDQMIAFASSLGLAGRGYALAPDALVVRADLSDPTLVHLTRGRVEPLSEARVEILPGLRTLAAGAALHGQARVRLPLRAWHPNDGESALEVLPSRAVLEIGVLPLGVEVRDWPLLQGGTQVPARASAITAQTFVRGAARTIP